MKKLEISEEEENDLLFAIGLTLGEFRDQRDSRIYRNMKAMLYRLCKPNVETFASPAEDSAAPTS